jgi:YfiH family protein
VREAAAGTLRAASAPALQAIPRLVHGFEQRLGPAGCEERDESRQRVEAALSPHGRLLLLTQVHGTAVRAAPWRGRPEGDAALAREPGSLLGIETADCLPILLVDPRLRLVGAAHAGWRGTAAGVARELVVAMNAAGARVQEMLAALGPAIGPCCYEVGDEVRLRFGAAAARLFRPGPRARPHLDLRGANVQQLLEAGLRPEQIHHVSDCTYCRPDLYHSYRREGRGGGRMINYIGFSSA